MDNETKDYINQKYTELMEMYALTEFRRATFSYRTQKRLDEHNHKLLEEIKDYVLELLKFYHNDSNIRNSELDKLFSATVIDMCTYFSYGGGSSNKRYQADSDFQLSVYEFLAEDDNALSFPKSTLAFFETFRFENTIKNGYKEKIREFKFKIQS